MTKEEMMYATIPETQADADGWKKVGENYLFDTYGKYLGNSTKFITMYKVKDKYIVKNK